MRETMIHPRKRRWRPILALAVLTCLGACRSSPAPDAADTLAGTQKYPPAARSSHVDVYHGVRVADPYRWMERLERSRTKNWVEAQNRLSQPYLESIPERAWIKERLTELWNYQRNGVPIQEGGRYFWTRNAGLQDQSVLEVADTLQSAPRLLLDPNALSGDATIALADFRPSPDGRHVAYALSDGGTDWKSWRVRNVETAQDLPEVLGFIKFTEVSWDRDSSGFYYSRYPADREGRGDDSKQVAIYHHRLGEQQSRDKLVYAVRDHATRNPYPRVSEDGQFLIIELFDGYAANGVYYLPLQRSGYPAAAEPVKLLDDWDGLYTYLGSDGPVFYLFTTQGAPRGRVVAVDTRNPQHSAWREVVPEMGESLEKASYVGGQLIAVYLRDAQALVKVFETSGQLRHQVPLPGNGTVDGFQGHVRGAETFFAYTDYVTPTATYRYDVVTNRVELFRAPRIAADTSPYVTQQVFFTSKDGTRVPMFITHRREFEKNGRAPLLLYGYGGFSNALTPIFSPSVLVWLEMGGAYAVANLRGGSEYGEAWHQAGTKSAKQNVFDDFSSAARWLIDNQYTSREHLAVIGRSNGGLLVGAALTQEPNLFAAALPAVGVLDMLRYQTASANARQWSTDFGLSEDPADFPVLLSYSPYHNVHPGTCYPPTLITTADHDDRVVPWHSYKFGAALQAAQGCANPILVRVETRAGHGAGKPVWMQIEDVADQWAFLTKHLQMKLPESLVRVSPAGAKNVLPSS